MSPDPHPTDALLTEGLDESERVRAARACLALWKGDPAPSADGDPFERLAAAGRCEVDGGHVVGIHGLTRNPTPHRIVHGDAETHTWCGWDAIGIPAALGADATAETSCPRCSAPITITISAGVPRDDGVAVVWLPSSAGADLMADFCSRSNVFCSRAHLDEWRAGRGGSGECVSVSEAADRGRATWADVAAAAG